MPPIPLLIIFLAVFCLWTREMFFQQPPPKKDPNVDFAKALNDFLKESSQNQSKS